MGFAPKNVIIVAGMNESKSSFCAILSYCFNVTKITIHLSIGG